MSIYRHSFQDWLDVNGVNDVRFYPQNPTRSTPLELMDEALRAVKAFEAGKTVPYEDRVETFLDQEPVHG